MMRFPDKTWRKRKQIIAALLLCGALCVTGCGAGANPQTQESEAGEGNLSAPADELTSEAEAAAPLELLTGFLTEEELETSSPWPSCDDTALAAVMKKAERGEPVTIACIGGSITQGVISSGGKDSEVGFRTMYAELFRKWWEERFPQTQVSFVNAGIGGTDSYLGVHRLQRDVLDYDPDLVLVEYSVNDGDTSFCKKTYDNLVRNILLSENAPAVMLLFMAQTNGATAQSSHVMVGFTYQLPMVSYGDVIKQLMENGRYTAGELAGDEVHPSALGHAITGEILWHYLNKVYENRQNYGEPASFAQSPLTKEAYRNARLADKTNITPDQLGTFVEKKGSDYFPNGWVCESGEGEITFTATFRNLGLLYLATTDGKSGQFEVFVDGESVRIIDANFVNGWGNAVTGKEVYTSSEEAEHTVTIRKADGSSGDVFWLLSLLMS